jgi:hypothetical protein
MSSNLERQLRELAERTNAETRSLPPEQAREVRAASLARARELTARSSGPELRLVNRAPMPPPGQTGMRKAERRRR